MNSRDFFASLLWGMLACVLTGAGFFFFTTPEWRLTLQGALVFMTMPTVVLLAVTMAAGAILAKRRR